MILAISTVRSKRLFKYPSEDRIGELMNSTVIENSLLSSVNEKIQSGNNFVIAGNVIMILFGFSVAGVIVECVRKKLKNKK